MADLEQRVDKLEEKVRQLEIDINRSLSDIKSSLVEIKATLTDSASNGDLKNQLIEKDVRNNANDIAKLKENQAKVVWAIVMAFLGLVGEALIYFIQNKS